MNRGRTMSHQSRNQRTLPSFDKITTHCRRAVLGIISPLIAMTVAGMPATAEDLRLIGLGRRAGARYIVRNHRQSEQLFRAVSARPSEHCQFCRQRRLHAAAHLSHNTVTVRAFNKMLLNEPWVVAQAVVLGSGVQIRQQPTLGSRHLTITFDVDARGGVNEIAAWVFLKVSASASLPATVTKPICPFIPRIPRPPRPGEVELISCSRDADVTRTTSVKCLAAFATHRPLQSLQSRGSRLPRCGI